MWVLLLLVSVQDFVERGGGVVACSKRQVRIHVC